jgi:glycosyltransferase involved in cell wall biosynthesis
MHGRRHESSCTYLPKFERLTRAVGIGVMWSFLSVWRHLVMQLCDLPREVYRFVRRSLAFGVPVITTQSAGSVVTQGKEGLIAPERNSDAIAMAIEKIIRNRDLRAAMAEAAPATAANFDKEPWGNRLVETPTVLAD